MFANVLLVVMSEAAEATGMEQDKNNHDLSITHTIGLFAVLGILSSIKILPVVM